MLCETLTVPLETEVFVSLTGCIRRGSESFKPLIPCTASPQLSSAAALFQGSRSHLKAHKHLPAPLTLRPWELAEEPKWAEVKCKPAFSLLFQKRVPLEGQHCTETVPVKATCFDGVPLSGISETEACWIVGFLIKGFFQHFLCFLTTWLLITTKRKSCLNATFPLYCLNPNWLFCPSSSESIFFSNS